MFNLHSRIGIQFLSLHIDIERFFMNIKNILYFNKQISFIREIKFYSVNICF